MYVSDYGFSASPSSWTTKLGGYGDFKNDYSNPIIKANNWLFAGSVHSYEWTMSRNSSSSVTSFSVYLGGDVYSSFWATGKFAARAVFYLQSSTNLMGGMGTEQNPYRI